MLRLRLGAIALLVLGVACGDDNIPLGIEMVGPRAPSSPGPQGPSSEGPGELGAGASEDDVAAVAIVPASLSLVVGDSVRVLAAAVDQNGLGLTGVTFAWASSDTRVVRVRADPEQSELATVTAVGSGTAAISVTAGSATSAALVTVARRP
jgi:hypothetical protein